MLLPHNTGSEAGCAKYTHKKDDPCLASAKRIHTLKGHRGKQSKIGSGIEDSDFKNRVLTVKVWIKTRCESAIYRRMPPPRRRRQMTQGLLAQALPHLFKRRWCVICLYYRDKGLETSAERRATLSGVKGSQQNLKNLLISVAGKKEKFDCLGTPASLKAGQIALRPLACACARGGNG